MMDMKLVKSNQTLNLNVKKIENIYDLVFKIRQLNDFLFDIILIKYVMVCILPNNVYIFNSSTKHHKWEPNIR